MSGIPAGSSKQSDMDKECDGNDPTTCSILDLNDDCLEHVCSFLTLRDQMNLSETCIYLSGIPEIIFRKNKSLTIYRDELTLSQIENILIKAGHHLHLINLLVFDKKTSNLILQLIARMCLNLQEFIITRYSDSLTLMNLTVPKEIWLNLNNLIKIDLSICDINDEFLQTLLPLQNLKYIIVAGNCITGRYLNCFPRLVHLDLFACTSIEPCFFNSVCENGSLKWLNVRACPNLHRYGLSDAILKLKHLEELRICTGPNGHGLNIITQLESLKVLTIFRTQNLTVDFFKELVANTSEKLESLTLVDFVLSNEKMEYICKLENLKILNIRVPNNKSDEFVQKISNLKQLKYLGLGLNYCRSIYPDALIKLFEQQTEIVELYITGNWNITKEDFFEIAKTIKARGTKSHCTIYAHRTRLTINLLKDERYMEYAPFLSLKFRNAPYFKDFKIWFDTEDIAILQRDDYL